jgi:hypothetical protein
VPDGALVGLGVDQESALCVEANGVGKLFTTKGGFAWLLQPESPRAAPMIGAGVPLDRFFVDITGVGPGSSIDLKTMYVASPAFQKTVEVREGILRN